MRSVARRDHAGLRALLVGLLRQFANRSISALDLRQVVAILVDARPGLVQERRHDAFGWRLGLCVGQGFFQFGLLLLKLGIVLIGDLGLGKPGLDLAELALDGLPLAVVIRGQHPHRSDQHRDARDAEHDVQQLGVAQSLFSSRHVETP